METENSRTGRQSKNNNLNPLSQNKFVLAGLMYLPNHNNNNTQLYEFFNNENTRKY